LRRKGALCHAEDQPQECTPGIFRQSPRPRPRRRIAPDQLEELARWLDKERKSRRTLVQTIHRMIACGEGEWIKTFLSQASLRAEASRLNPNPPHYDREVRAPVPRVLAENSLASFPSVVPPASGGPVAPGISGNYSGKDGTNLPLASRPSVAFVKSSGTSSVQRSGCTSPPCGIQKSVGRGGA